MVGLSRCVAPLATLLASVSGARVAKRRSSVPQTTKFIAGVPVVNYQVGLEEGLQEEWIVMMKPAAATDAEINALCESAVNGCKIVGHPDKGGVPFFVLQGTEAELEAVIASNSNAILVCDPSQKIDMIPEIYAEPTSTMWGLDRIGANKRDNFGAGVSIYILDTGVRTTHQDFGHRASPDYDFTADPPVQCDGDLECAADDNGHGTHCAGTAAGATYGVAPEAHVYGVKVLATDGSGGSAGIMNSLDYLATSSTRPAVASMSLGGPCILAWCNPFSGVKVAIDIAVRNGVTVVVAGGNFDSDACSVTPAFVPTAITVGSTDSLNARSYFSSYGSCTDIWAPGSDITSASSADDTGSVTYSGTSMACPHVAGGAALVLEQNPGFVSEQVLDRLLSDAATNYITDMQDGDTNKMLYVASDAPPPEGSVSSPAPPACPGYCFVCLTPMCSGCC